MKVGRLFRESMVNRIKDNVESNTSAFVFNYHSLTASKMDELRKELKKQSASVYIARNNIAKIALDDLDLKDLGAQLDGQTAFVWGEDDASEISKTLVNFSKDCDGFVVRGGVLEGATLSSQDVKRLSDLPSREVLLAQLLGNLQAPLTRLAGALNAKTQDLLSVLKQLSEQKGGK